MYMIIFDVESSIIVGVTDGSLTLEECCSSFPKKAREKLDSIYVDVIPEDGYINYKVQGNTLVRMSDTNILEVKQHGRLLSEDERKIAKLKPTAKEIQKAESTLEVLSILQEVL